MHFNSSYAVYPWLCGLSGVMQSIASCAVYDELGGSYRVVVRFSPSCAVYLELCSLYRVVVRFIPSFAG